MLIEDYFQQIRFLIEGCTGVQSFDINCENRGIYQGFVRDNLYFEDGSILHIREFVDVKKTIDRKMYSYQYMDAAKSLIFRYDDTEHHQKLNLPNFPHHKHAGSEDNILSSNVPMLAEVLHEIEQLLP
ncbi:MAG: hypothetical protein GDA43_25085 [Hormoscilla sp. SP5CHS1]|nr:hypothetical protein [Hormoscilla sp. SP12CHS1]MBC6456051.1 hypothetical protein [Hormoscilla sp. SP5CHS1]